MKLWLSSGAVRLPGRHFSPPASRLHVCQPNGLQPHTYRILIMHLVEKNNNRLVTTSCQYAQQSQTSHSGNVSAPPSERFSHRASEWSRSVWRRTSEAGIITSWSVSLAPRPRSPRRSRPSCVLLAAALSRVSPLLLLLLPLD